MEFIARFGERFMCRYYRAWLEVPGGLSLAAVDSDGKLVGVLLGAVDPPVHTAAMVRVHGLALAGRLLAAAATRPVLAKDLIATRASRYARGLWRILVRPIAGRGRHDAGAAPMAGGASPQTSSEGRVGEITHVLVSPDHQNQGIGKTLLAAAEREARRAGLDHLVLVTPPDQAARLFYERLGWIRDGSVNSRSGESYLRYRYPL